MRPTILVVSSDGELNERLTALFQPRGWDSLKSASMREAVRALRDDNYDVVLALEMLSDGHGYELSGIVTRKRGSLFVGVPLTESCLWLPVVRKGKKVLGERAVGPTEIGLEIEHLVHERCAPPAEPSNACEKISGPRKRSAESRRLDLHSRTAFAVPHHRSHLDQRPYGK